MTKKESDHLEKLKYWQDHIAQAAQFEGSIPAYCRSAGIRDHTFYYWQKKLGGKREETAARREPSPFIKMEVQRSAIERDSSKLPDPKWVAAVILYLQEGLQ